MSQLGRPKVTYTESQKTEFIELAQEIGIHMAIKELRYPSYKAARAWFDQHGLEYPRSALQTLAGMTKNAYTVDEMAEVGQQLLDSIQEDLMKPDLTAAEKKALSDAYSKTINSLQLLRGKATHIKQEVDSFDAEYQSIIEAAKAENAKYEHPAE